MTEATVTSVGKEATVDIPDPRKEVFKLSPKEGETPIQFAERRYTRYMEVISDVQGRKFGIAFALLPAKIKKVWVDGATMVMSSGKPKNQPKNKVVTKGQRLRNRGRLISPK